MWPTTTIERWQHLPEHFFESQTGKQVAESKFGGRESKPQPACSRRASGQRRCYERVRSYKVDENHPFVYARLQPSTKRAMLASRLRSNHGIDQLSHYIAQENGIEATQKANIYYDLSGGNFDDRVGLQSCLRTSSTTKDGLSSLLLNHSAGVAIQCEETICPFYERDILLYSTSDNLLSSTTEPDRMLNSFSTSSKA